MNKRSIVVDVPSVEVPALELKDEYMLNSQSAFNRRTVEKSERCGCFHCGSIFSGGQVSGWISEPDGDDTALCPYCDIDAVIVGTGDFPLSTALLALLHEKWFSEELGKRKESSNWIPDYFGRDDYLRKGIPFRYEYRPEIEVVGEIDLFPVGWLDAHPLYDGQAEADRAVENDVPGGKGEPTGGVVKIRAYFDSNGYYVSDFLDARGTLLPYEPWTGAMQDLLLELTEKHGDRLKGQIKEPSSNAMQLFVEHRGSEQSR